MPMEIEFRVWDKQRKEYFSIKDGFVMALGERSFKYALVTNQGLYKIPNTGQKDLGEDRWVHKDINLMKRTLTDKEFLDFCEKVVHNSKK
jgi:hypothetical protein